MICNREAVKTTNVDDFKLFDTEIYELLIEESD